MSVIISVVHEEKVCQCSDIEPFMFKLYRLIFQPIMQVVTGLGYFTKGLLGYNISEFC